MTSTKTYDMLHAITLDARRCTSRPGAKMWPEGSVHRLTILEAPGATWTGHYSVGPSIPITAAHEAARAGGERWQAYGLRLKNAGSKGSAIFTPTAADVLGVSTFNRDQDLRPLRAQIANAYQPSLEDVVSAVLLDSMDCYEGQTFRQWVEDADAGTMHAADALDIYQVCMGAMRWCKTAFGEQLEDAQEWAAER